MGRFNNLFSGLFGPRRPLARRGHFPATVSELVSYGKVNQWHLLSLRALETLADRMVLAGFSAMQFEYLAAGSMGFYASPKPVIDKFATAWNHVLRPRKLAACVTIVNGNVGGGGVAENGGVSICNSQFNNQWFTNLVGSIIGLSGADEGIWLCPVSELGCRNKDCRAKGRGWVDIGRQLHTGHCLWNGNGDSSPNNALAGFDREWHCSNVNHISAGAYNVTDHSNVLNQLGGLRNHVQRHDLLAQMVRACRVRNAGFGYYQFWSPDGKPDWAAIDTIGAALKGAS